MSVGSRDDFWNEPVKPMDISEFPKCAIFLSDYLYEYFREGNRDLRKLRRSELKKSGRNDLEARFRLAKNVYRFANKQSSLHVKNRHLNLAFRLFYLVYRNPNPNWAKSGLYLGTIHFIQGREEESIFYWKWVAHKGNSADKATSSAMYNLGVHYKKIGSRGDAINWLEKSQMLGNPSAAQSLKELLKAPRPVYGLDPRGAELLIQEWMIHWGFYDAKATPIGPDGGFDIISTNAAAQVKFRNQASTLEQINSFHGACNSSFRYEIFVSKSGFTKKALETGTSHGMALFGLQPDGTPLPMNPLANKLSQSGRG